MAIELAQAYVSLSVEAKNVPKEVESALSDGAKGAKRIGQDIGNDMGDGVAENLSSKMKTVVAGIAASAGVATVATMGFNRLADIEDSKDKLRGIGTSATDTAIVMQNALGAVQGTMYSLGDASTVAASAVAAGIKPGQDLSKYLALVADSASVAGTGLGEMGDIFNTVASQGRATTENLNQLAQRGVPIFQWLGEEMGATQEDVRALASKGKVSFEEFDAAMTKHVGGAAQGANSTVRGSFENMKAALGRLSAAAQGPVFDRLAGVFRTVTSTLDSAGPAATSFAESLNNKVFRDWPIDFQAKFGTVPEIIGKAKQAWTDFTQIPAVSNTFDSMIRAFSTLRSNISTMVPIALELFETFGKASATLGVGTWQLLVTALEALNGVLSVLNPVLSAVSGFFASNQAAAVGLMGAILVFRTAPAIMARFASAVSPVGTAYQRAMTPVRNFGAAYSNSIRTAQAAAGRAAVMGAGVIGPMTAAQTRLADTSIRSATGMNRLGQAMRGSVAGGAAVAGSGLSKLSGALGGPVMIALMATLGATMKIASQNSKASSTAKAYADSQRDLAEATDAVSVALIKSRGSFQDDNVVAKTDEQLKAYVETLDSTSKKTSGFNWNPFSKIYYDTTGKQSGAERVKDAAAFAQGQEDAIAKVMGSTKNLSNVLVLGRDSFNGYMNALRNTGDEGKAAAAKITEMYNANQQLAGAAKSLTPGVAAINSAITAFGDNASSTEDKVTALDTALDSLFPAASAQEAEANANKAFGAIKKQLDETKEKADAADGIGAKALIGAGGKLNTKTANGQQAFDQIQQMVEVTKRVAAAGGDLPAQWARNEEALKSMGETYGLTTAEITEAARQLQLSKSIDIVYGVSGNPNEVIRQLGGVAAGLDNVQSKNGVKTIEVRPADITKETGDYLNTLGARVVGLPNGMIQIQAKDETSATISRIIEATVKLNAVKGGPQLDLKTTLFESKNNDALRKLDEMNRKSANPLVNGDFTKFVTGQSLTLEQLANLDKQIANPEIRTAYEKALADIGLVSGALDEATRTRQSMIEIKANVDRILSQSNSTFDAPDSNQITDPAVRRTLGLDNAIGSIRKYATGGFTKMPKQALIQKADPAGGLVQWAEPSTKGEAFIPLADDYRRARATNILGTVAKDFGYQLVPTDNLTKFEDGGIRTTGPAPGSTSAVGTPKTLAPKIIGPAVSDFDNLALGKLFGDKPLEGSSYNWGGTHWGDCSGAMSAFANLAAGLPVWNSRFSTATMADELARRGAKSGPGGPGDLRFAWLNGGPGGGHTAGILPSNTPVEMGGARGNGQYNSRTDFSQFTDWAFFPGGMFKGGSGTGGDYGTLTGGGGAAGGSKSSNIDALSGGSSSPKAVSETISGRFGDAAKEAVGGQISDLLGVFGIPDDPSQLAAYSQFDAATKEYKTNWENAKKARSELTADQARDRESALKEQQSGSASSTTSPADKITNTPGMIPAPQKYDKKRGPEQWQGYSEWVLGSLNLPKTLAGKMIQQIGIESGGDPSANDGKGHKGLLQLSENTFKAFKSKILTGGISSPLPNLFAGANYANNDPKYASKGGIATVWPAPQGYKNGGWTFGPGGPRGDGFLIRASDGEFMTQAASARRAPQALSAMNANPAVAASVNDMFTGAAATRALNGVAGQPDSFKRAEPGNVSQDVHFHFGSVTVKDVDELQRKMGQVMDTRTKRYSGRPV